VLLSPDNVRNDCLGRIGRHRVCVLQAGLCDVVVKHEKHKLEIEEAMVHIMAPATKQMKFAAYEAPALAVATLTDKQFGELTQEQHSVNDWNRIILAIKAGRFENKSEYEKIKQRASKKSVFSHFNPRKNVKFGLEVLAPSVQEIKLEASTEVPNLLKPRRPAMEGAAHALTGNYWEALCTYVQMLNDKLPELQEIMANLEEVLTGRLLGVEDELGVTLAELGSGDSEPGGHT
jgi:hypothetical protein